MSSMRGRAAAHGSGTTDRVEPSPFIAENEVFVRMTGNQRLQHALLLVSFTMLVATGFPLVFPNAPIFKSVAGEFWLRSLLHRIAGVGLIVVSLWHLAYALLTEEGGRYFREMMPRLVDARQMVQSFLHKLGLMEALYRRGILRGFLDRYPALRFREPPLYDRFNWIEKFEYLAVLWGNLVMIGTGLCLWFFQAAFALFPKQVMDIIKLVHGFEALLAFLAIIIWHMYNVHLNPEVFPMSRIWFDGTITGAELRRHYPGWYLRIARERAEKIRVEAALREYEERHGP